MWWREADGGRERYLVACVRAGAVVATAEAAAPTRQVAGASVRGSIARAVMARVIATAGAPLALSTGPAAAIALTFTARPAGQEHS